MGMKLKKVLFLLLALCLALELSGCRRRTGAGQQDPGAASSADIAEETRPGNHSSQKLDHTAEVEPDPSADKNSGEPSRSTRENPDASRKEYDENAPAEIVPGTDRLLHSEGEGSGASTADAEAETAVRQVNDLAEETASQTVAAEEAEQTGVSEDAEAADSALTYFNVLLRDRMGSLFECQRLDLYWETAQDHVTIHKTAPEHTLILDAGCYDVSARLLPENLLVDDGWIARKNPGIIVKIVDSSILGSGIGSDRKAAALYEKLRSREGWSAIDAVKNDRILLLSGELLEAPYRQTAAMVMIARTASPTLFPDVDPEEMLRMLTEEATGTQPTGIYYYCKEE